MQVKRIRISDYSYELPESRIAKHPLDERDQSKVLVYKSGKIKTDKFQGVSQYLPQNSMLVLNNTRVVRARLKFKKNTGAVIEIFLIEPINPADYALSFTSTTKVIWKCIVGNLKRWKHGDLEMMIGNSNCRLTAKKIGMLTEGLSIEFSWDCKSMFFSEVIEQCGKIPIPPYLNRDSEEIDSTRYQTIYADPAGSVAAPTAGLHFTDKVFADLKLKEIVPNYITLHVGAGTFKPVSSDTLEEHEMHTEHFFVEQKFLEKLITNEHELACVGTTTLRTLESIYWLGVKAITGKLNSSFFISQWEPYEIDADIPPKIAYKALLKYLKELGIETLSATTQIIIVPGYEIKTADILITNFHQPRSTLLLLVAAAVGDDWKKIYQHALEKDFRFLSYGDSNLLYINRVKPIK